MDNTRPFWRATKYDDLDHSSIPRWHASMRAAVIDVASMRFDADRDIMDTLVQHPRRRTKKGVRGREGGEKQPPDRASAIPGDVAVRHALR